MKISLSKRVKTIFSFIFINIFQNILGIVRSKIIAVFYGVGQVGLLGQFNTFFGLQSKIITFGTSASLINSYNYAKNNSISGKSVLFINFLIIFSANLVNNLFILIFADWLSKIIYDNSAYKLWVIFGLFLNIVYSLSTFFELTFQAKKYFKILSRARIVALIGGFISSVPLTYLYGIKGIILNFILIYTLSFIYLVIHSEIFRYINIEYIKNLYHNFNKSILKLILIISLTDVLRSFIVLGSLFLIRIILIHSLGAIFCGYYQALVSISNYINILAEGFIVYYFPMISSVARQKDIKDEINLNFEILFYLIAPVLLILFMGAEIFLKLLFSSEFSHLAAILKWLLAFKILYILYYFFSINLLARNYLRKFISIESIRSLYLIISTIFLSKYYGFKGAIIALISTDLISTIVMLIVTNRISYFQLIKMNNIRIWVLLFSLVLASLPVCPFYMKVIIIVIIIIFMFDLKKIINILQNLKEEKYTNE